MNTAKQGRLFGLAALALTAAACAEQRAETQTYPVLVRALSDDGDPLADLEIEVSGVVVGRTGADGSQLLQMAGNEGAQLLFEPRCPGGSNSRGEAPALRLRTLAGGPPPEVEVVCGRDKRMAALVVNTQGFGNLPVLVHDREVARTDETGTAHVLLEGTPSTPMRVVLDTSSLPRVVPPSPHQDVQIGKRDTIVVFAPELAEIREPEKKKRRVKKEKPPVVIRPEKLR
jgi:hypothetical protein